MVRLFVALQPPVEVAHALLARLKALELPPHRVTALDQLHLTVLFVGEADARELPKLIESVERATAAVPEFALTPLSMQSLPQDGPARLIAALTDAPRALGELRARLVSRLAVGRHKSGELLPHLTLCRFQTPTRCELPSLDLEHTPFEVSSVSLVQSQLRPDGAEHRQIARFQLASRP